MKPIKRGLEEFLFLLSEKYVKNIQASTHKHYELEILEIFKIRRHGGKMTMKKPFKIMQEFCRMGYESPEATKHRFVKIFNRRNYKIK
jgi:hypothetical protein